MRLTRRHALMGGLSLPFVRFGGLGEASAQAITAATIVTVTGVDARTPTSRLRAVVETFTDRGLPVAVSLAAESGRTFAAREYLRRLAARDDVELVAYVPTLGGSRYRRAQVVADQLALLRTQLGRAIGGSRGVAIANDEPINFLEDGAELATFGVTTVIRLGANRTGNTVNPHVVRGGYWITSTGLVNTFALRETAAQRGGDLVSTAQLINGIRSASRLTPPVVIDLNLAILPRDITDLRHYAEDIVAGIAGLLGDVRVVLPRTLRRQTAPHGPKYLVVAFDAGHDPIVRSSAAALFAAAGVPVTGLVAADESVTTDMLRGLSFDDIGIIASRDFPAIEGVAERLIAASLAGPSTVILPAGLRGGGEVALARSIGRIGVRLLVNPNLAAGRPEQLPDNGLLEIAGIVRSSEVLGSDIRGALASRLATRDQLVLIADGPTLASRSGTEALVAGIAGLRDSGGAIPTNGRGLVEARYGGMGLVTLVQRSRAAAALTGVAPEVPRRQLEEDAATAWRYFDRARVGDSPFALGAAMPQGDGVQGWGFYTMWDLASFVLGYVSASMIGLIDSARLERGLRAVRDILATDLASTGAHALPPEVIDISTGLRSSGDFDGMDVGRLLIALHIAEAATGGAFDFRRLVEGWALPDIIIDREVYNIREGQLLHIQDNSYAGYASRGFRLWGFDVRSPLDAFPTEGRFDDLMTLFETLAPKTRISTEPHTTEAVELGASPVAKAIADLVYAAQVRRYEETGILTAISEGGIDREPWFTYEGFQIDPDGDGTFVVDMIRPGAAFRLPGFVSAVRKVSTKACFLWRATRPSTYTQRLHQHARLYGRNALGFASGVNESTGRPTLVSDVNTSGIVLESIAHLLKGAPLAEVVADGAADA
ncbi:MAG: DUF3131 domain-containing protein [Bauldia sp.]